MSKSLQKRPNKPPQKKSGRGQHKDLVKKANKAVSEYLGRPGAESAMIPNASMIYGVAAAVLFALSLYHLVSGGLVYAFLLLIIGGLMFAYAVFFIRSVDKKPRK